MALPVTISGFGTALPLLGPFKTSTGPALAQGVTGVDNSVGFTFVGGQWAGQSFTPDTTITVNGISLFMSRVTPAPNYGTLITIRANDPSGAVLATSDQVAPSTVGSSKGYIKYNFQTPVTLQAGVTYGFRIATTNLQSGYGYSVAGASTDVLSGGEAYNDNGATGGDLAFVMHTGANDVFYVFGADANGIVVAKATDPSSAWTTAASYAIGQAPTALTSYQVGNIIHLIYGYANAGNAFLNYMQFDMGLSGFIGFAETVLNGVITTGQLGALVHNASLVVRSNGEAVVLFNGLQTKTSGTYRARVYHTRRTAPQTWSAPVQVDANTAHDFVARESTLGAGDLVHMWWFNQTLGQGQSRTLSAANALNTVFDCGSVGTSTYDYASDALVETTNTRVAYAYGNATSNNIGRFLSAANPTFTTGSQNPSGAAQPTRLRHEGTDFYAVSRNSSGNSITISKSSDFGATWSAPTSSFSGSIAGSRAALSRDGSTYQRSAFVVVPYFVNDGGVWKYNEYTIRTLGAIGTGSLNSSVSDVDGVGAVVSLPAVGTGNLVTVNTTGQRGAGVGGSVGTGDLTSTAPAVVGTGTTGWNATGALVATGSTLSAVGAVVWPPVAGTGALTSTVADLDALGVSRSVGAAALVATTSVLVSTGSAFWKVTGTLAANVADLDANGFVVDAPAGGTGALLSTASVAAAAGVSRSSGAGTLTSTVSNLGAVGVSRAVGTATLVAPDRTVAGVGQNAISATGALQTLPAALSGVGVVMATGTATLQSGLATGTAVGVSKSVGVAALQSVDSVIVGTLQITGTGVLTSTATLSGAGVSRSSGVASLLATSAVATGPGLSVSRGTAVLVDGPAGVTGSGSLQGAGVGALGAQGAGVAGLGVTQWVMTGTLQVTTATASGTGLPLWVATGVLTPAKATVSGVGQSSSTASANLQASVASVYGSEGVSVIGGVGSVPAQSAHLDGTGIVRATGTGTLSSVASIAGVGLSRSTGTAAVISLSTAITATGKVTASGTGALVAATATVSGAGKNSWVATGELNAASYTLACNGTAQWTSTGTLVAQAAEVEGSGTLGTKGAGTLVATRSTVYGYEGVSVIDGIGVLQARAGDVTGAGNSRWIGTGGLPADSAGLSGVAVSQSRGSGALIVLTSDVVGVGGLVDITGTGELQSKPAEIFGTANLTSSGSGVLVESPHLVAGVGRSVSTGTGTLKLVTASIVAGVGNNETVGFGDLKQTYRAYLIGHGTVSWPVDGVGTLQAKASKVVGQGRIVVQGQGQLVAASSQLDGSDQEVVTGDGVLAAVFSQVEGIGDVVTTPTWPTPKPLPPSYPGTAPWQGATASFNGGDFVVPWNGGSVVKPWRRAA